MTELNSLMSTLRVEDIPAQEARPFKAVGIIGEIEQKDVSNGKVMITVPFTYRLRETDTADRTFYARIFVRPEWFTPEFAQAASNGGVDEKEVTSFNINVKGLLRGLFRAAGVTEGTLDLTTLTGRLAGFATKPQSNEPDRLQVSYFFAPNV